MVIRKIAKLQNLKIQEILTYILLTGHWPLLDRNIIRFLLGLCLIIDHLLCTYFGRPSRSIISVWRIIIWLQDGFLFLHSMTLVVLGQHICYIGCLLFPLCIVMTLLRWFSSILDEFPTVLRIWNNTGSHHETTNWGINYEANSKSYLR